MAKLFRKNGQTFSKKMSLTDGGTFKKFALLGRGGGPILPTLFYLAKNAISWYWWATGDYVEKYGSGSSAVCNIFCLLQKTSN